MPDDSTEQGKKKRTGEWKKQRRETVEELCNNLLLPIARGIETAPNGITNPTEIARRLLEDSSALGMKRSRYSDPATVSRWVLIAKFIQDRFPRFTLTQMRQMTLIQLDKRVDTRSRRKITE